MKKKKLETQYDPHAEKYTDLRPDYNEKSTSQYFKLILKYVSPTEGLRLIDLGCGSGDDFSFYEKKKFKCFGLEASSGMYNLVREKHPGVQMSKGSFTKDLQLENLRSFDVVVSKWAIQTARKTQKIYEQVVRIVKPGGYFIFLTVHLLRHFLEKKKSGKNYFKQEIVASEIFDKQITVYEPTHTLQEYLSPYFLEHFELLEIKEDYEFPAAEQIGGDIYPTHLIVVARKK